MKALFVTFLAFWALQAFSAETNTSMSTSTRTSTWQRVKREVRKAGDEIDSAVNEPQGGNQHSLSQNLKGVGGELKKTARKSAHALGLEKKTNTSTDTSTGN